MARKTKPADSATLFEELKTYIGLTSDDERALAALAPLVRASFPAIADDFYDVIRQHPGALAVLVDEAQTRRLHATLQVWLEELLTGPRDASYYARRCRIGQEHVRVGLAQHYMVTAMSRVRVALHRAATEALPDPEQASRCRLAIARACDIDLAIMLDSYRRDSMERVERVKQRERDDLEATLTERKRFLDEALDVAAVAILGFDPEGRLCFFNQRAETLTGYAYDEVIDTDPFDRLFGPGAAQVRGQFLSAKGTEPVASESDLRTKSGKVRRITWRSAAHGGDHGAYVVAGMDVTEQRELEWKMRQAERLAAAGALAAGLAHEIRNPLNGAGLHLSILERALARASNVPETVPEALGVLRSEIRRLSSLVTEFLEVARPRPLAVGEHDLNPVAEGVVTLVGPEAHARLVALRLESSRTPAVGRFDAERVKQVILNLVRNALESVPEGGNVVLRVRRTAQTLEVDVEDDGPGFDPTAPIFDAFFTTKDKGTGLGLSIVSRIVSDHGGDVRFTTQPGSTVFTVRLPASF